MQSELITRTCYAITALNQKMVQFSLLFTDLFSLRETSLFNYVYYCVLGLLTATAPCVFLIILVIIISSRQTV